MGARCCDVCDPERFPVPLFEVEKIPGLKGGKKRKFPTELSDAIRTGLRKWSRDVLMPQLYPKDAGFSMTGSALLPDSTIEQIAMCGERVENLTNLQRRARWFLMPNHGEQLLHELHRIFDEYDASADMDPEEPAADLRGDMMDFILLGRGRGRGRGGRGGRRARGTANRARASSSRGRRATVVPSGPPRRGRSSSNNHAE